MTLLEQHILFYDILENTSPAFAVTAERPKSSVVDNYLNEATISFFNERYLPGNILQNIINIKGLKTELVKLLATKTIEIEQFGSNPYIYRTTASNETWDDFEYYVEGNIKVSRNNVLECVNDLVELTPINAVSINKYITNYTNVPILLQPVIVVDNGVSNSKGMIIFDKYTTPAEEIKIVVLKRPKNLKLIVSNASNIPEIDIRFHEQIVRLAVSLFLQDKSLFAQRSTPQETVEKSNE